MMLQFMQHPIQDLQGSCFAGLFIFCRTNGLQQCGNKASLRYFFAMQIMLLRGVNLESHLAARGPTSYKPMRCKNTIPGFRSIE